MRADARRNRDLILDAARAEVAESGLEATMEDIARRAGVAVGTLYRHFPAKDDLVSAVVEDGAAQVAVLAERALDAAREGAPPDAELAELFRAVAERHATDRAFKAATGLLDHDLETTLTQAAPTSSVGRAVRAIDALLDRARSTGTVRADLGIDDLVLLLGSVPGPEVSADRRARYLDIVLAGLRP